MELALPHHRKLDERSMSAVNHGYQQRNPGSKIAVNLLAQGAKIRKRDIYNQVQRLRNEELGGRSMIEGLIDQLRTYKDAHGQRYFYQVDYDHHGRVRHLFFAHPMSFDIIKRNPDVLVLDATYKTNKFQMPLLHIVGADCRSKPFDICYGFMSGETEAHYGWHIGVLHAFLETLLVKPKCFITDDDAALKGALRKQFSDVPQRLCIWHIYQNVLKQAMLIWDPRTANEGEVRIERANIQQARNIFMQEWQATQSQKTEQSFTEAWDAMIEKYSAYQPLIKYLQEQQYPSREGWAECYCRFMPDFGIKVTSTSESAHARLKKNLSFGSRSHLFDLLKDSSELLLAHVNEMQGDIAKEMSHVPTETMSLRFAILQRRISHIALRKVKRQYDLATSPDYTDDCSNAFTAKFGIPCKHWLRQMIDRQRVLVGNPQAVFQVPIDFIDQHWWLDPPRAKGLTVASVLQRFSRPLDPIHIQPRGRPKGATTKTVPTPRPRQNNIPTQPRDRIATELIAVAQEADILPPCTSVAVQKRKRAVKPTKPSKKATVVDDKEEYIRKADLEAMLNARDARNNESLNKILELLQAQSSRQRETVSPIDLTIDSDLGVEDRSSDGEFEDSVFDIDDLPPALSTRASGRSGSSVQAMKANEGRQGRKER